MFPNWDQAVFNYFFRRANAKLSYPDQALKLWSDVDGKEKRP